MKRFLTILAIVCVLIAALSITAFALEKNASGVYEIATAEDLIAFRETATNGDSAVLTADIDMTGKAWTPFGQIVVSVDGQGHSITGLSATVSDVSGDIGLFVNKLANNPGNPTIKNIVFKDGSFTVNNATGTCQIGFVAGYADRANVTGVTLDNCTMTVNHSGTGELSTGMIVGRADWSAQDNEIKIDGIVEDDCVFTVNADEKDNTYVGGIIGSHSSDTLAVRNAQFNGTITGTVKSGRIAAIACQMWGAAIMSGNTTTTDYPLTLSPGNILEYFTVGTTDELNAAIAKFNAGEIGYAYITLSADLDYTGKTFTPITGDFKGEFNGAGHTIKGINLVYENAPGGNYGVLVNCASNGGGKNGRVVNIVLEDCSITVTTASDLTAGVFVGGVIGYYNRGHVDNVTIKNVDVKVTSTTTGEIGAGGVVGKAEWAGPNGCVGFYNVTADKNCSVTLDGGDSTNARAGGIVGRAGSADRYTFENCVNYATVTSSHTAAGIIGYSGHWNSPANALVNCKNYGNIYGDDIAASLVGPCDGASLSITNSVAGGFIFGNVDTHATARPDATLTNVKTVSIINPVTPENDTVVTGYYQIQDLGTGKGNLRVVFFAGYDYILSASDLTITIAFTKGGDAVKQFTGDLATVYKSITAEDDLYIAPDEMVMFGNVITGIPATDADAFSVKVTDGDGNVLYTGNGTLEIAEGSDETTPDPEPTAVHLDTVAGADVHLWVTPFETPSEFSGNFALIYYVGSDDDYFTTINNMISAGEVYTVVTLNGTEYRVGGYANSGNIFRLELQSAGAVVYSGLTYTVKVEFYGSDDTLLYYSNEYTCIATMTSSNALERETMNVTLPDGLTKLSVAGYSTENINHWGDGLVEYLFDGDTTGTKMGGGKGDGDPTVYFTLTEAATVSYFTFTTGGDTGSYTDRNPYGFTLYGKVGDDWVVLADIRDNQTQTTGFAPADSTPYSYATTNPTECTEYKVVLYTGNAFQLNELELYAG